MCFSPEIIHYLIIRQTKDLGDKEINAKRTMYYSSISTVLSVKNIKIVQTYTVIC